MSGFGMIVEDPFYDEDGQLIDEDFDEIEDMIELGEISFDPHDTINS